MLVFPKLSIPLFLLTSTFVRIYVIVCVGRLIRTGANTTEAVLGPSHLLEMLSYTSFIVVYVECPHQQKVRAGKKQNYSWYNRVSSCSFVPS